ncbi:MAG: tetratricopeptide repeat protein [Anaerolineales bacterium]|nr:tetratricopeptide repeat protein [Anaerolineales bacterium]
MTVLRGNEDSFREAMNLGHSAAWENRWQEAVEHYTRAMNEFPDNPPMLNSLALAHLELGHLDEALQLYRRAARLSPEDPLPAEKVAWIYKQTNRTKESVQYSMRAAELYLRLRDADKAINNWGRAISLDPDNLDAHAHLALVYEKLGRTPQAISEHIAVAAVMQRAGRLDEARKTGEHALHLNPKSIEAQQAAAMLQANKPLPKPARQGSISGPLRLAPGTGRLGNNSPANGKPMAQLELEDGPDPLQEATEKALQTLAAMLFDLTPAGKVEVEPKSGSLRSIAKVVSDGLLARGFDEKAIVRHLNQAIQLETQKQPEEAAKQFEAAIQAGLEHAAAHFVLGLLLRDQGKWDAALPHIQKAVTHADYALAGHLLLAEDLQAREQSKAAVLEYLQALREADASVIAPEKSEALRQQYEPLLAAAEQNPDDAAIQQLCANIRHLLLRPGWRTGVNEARGQLPGQAEGSAPRPVADILTSANSGRLVDALAQISRISRQGHFRAAMEEAFTALEFSPTYLPLHMHMGELLFMNEHPERAVQKLATVARVYSARGENDRATQVYRRIVQMSPLDVSARTHLVERLHALGEKKEAVRETVELADVYYRQAQLTQARETYEKALRLSQGVEVDPNWNAQILHQIADIDLQRLDWRKALRVYEQLRTVAPEDTTARQNLVQLNLRLGQEAKANTELENYLSLLSSRSREQDAISFLSALADENGNYVLARRRLAEAYQQQGQRDAAISQWNKLGELLVQKGDRQGALNAVRAILALNPPNAERYQSFLKRLSK